MEEKLISRILALGIIFLFVGVSYTSAVTIDIKSTATESIKDFGCEGVTKTDLIYLKRQLNRFKVYSSLLSVLSRDNPELKEITEGLINEINKLIIQFEELKNEPIPLICDILIKISIQIDKVQSYFLNWMESAEENTIEWIVAFLSYQFVFEPLFGPIIIFVLLSWDIFQCEANIK